MAEKIFADVNKDGSIKLEFDGYTGNTCFDAADELKAALEEEGLGFEVQDLIKKKPERQTNKTAQKQKGG